MQLVARGDRMDLAGSKDGSSKLKRKNSVARNWSSRDVAEYLEGLTEVFGDRTKEYSNVMMSENINGEALMELSDSNLKEMKFTMGHRKLLLSRIALLAEEAQQAHIVGAEVFTPMQYARAHSTCFTCSVNRDREYLCFLECAAAAEKTYLTDPRKIQRSTWCA